MAIKNQNKQTWFIRKKNDQDDILQNRRFIVSELKYVT